MDKPNSTMKIVLIIVVAIVVLYIIYVLAALYLAGEIIDKTNQQQSQQPTYQPPYSNTVGVFSTPGLSW